MRQVKKEEIIGLYDKELYDEMMEYHKLKHAREDGIEQGRKDGIEQGLKQGAKENSKKIAKEMLGKNLELSLISECTGLSIEEIEKIRRNH